MKRLLSAILLAAAPLLAAGCSDSIADPDATIDATFFDHATAVPYQSLASSHVTLDQSSVGNSELAERQYTVIWDRKTYHALWDELHAGVRPIPPAPAVDFPNEMVIAAVLGLRSSAGYTVTIERVAVEGDRVGVLVRETAPGPGCGAAAVMTSPYHLVKTTARALPVDFVDMKSTRTCE